MSAPNRRTIIQLLALFLLLAALPAGSWYYLKSGLDYHRKAMAELKDLGPLPVPASVLPPAGAVLPADSLNGRLVITGFINLSEKTALDNYGVNWSKLHEQFDERKDVLFITYAKELPGDTATLQAFIRQYGLLDKTQYYFFTASPEQWQAVKAAYGLPADSADKYWIALADISSKLRRYYDPGQPAEIKRLVEHIALLAPRKKDRELLYKREREK